MATSAAQTRLTPEEYIAFERKALPDAEIIRTDFQAFEEVLPLTSTHCELPLREIYERVSFSDEG